MAPKRPMEITVIDENDRVLYTIFRNTANNLSQFYAQSVNLQKLNFEAGQKYAILQLHEWIAEKLQEGKMVTVPEILAYLQAKLSGCEGEQGEASGSRQNSASQETGPEMQASTSAPQDEGSDPEMQMD